MSKNVYSETKKYRYLKKIKLLEEQNSLTITGTDFQLEINQDDTNDDKSGSENQVFTIFFPNHLKIILHYTYYVF